jgi:hypothetical protein
LIDLRIVLLDRPGRIDAKFDDYCGEDPVAVPAE